MTITNKTVRDAQKNISEDVDLIDPKGPEAPKGQYDETIARGKNVRLPSGQVLSPEAQIMFSKSIVARKLGAPAGEEIEVKNLNYHYFWGNHTGAAGSRYAKLKSMGYTDATLDDVTPKAVEVSKSQNQITWGDLILMKIEMQRWMQHEKAKMEHSLQLQRRARRGYAAPPNPDVHSEEAPQLQEAPEFQQSGPGKYWQNYVADDAELTKKMGEDKQAGRT
jgi:hypothetical protein